MVGTGHVGWWGPGVTEIQISMKIRQVSLLNNKSYTTKKTNLTRCWAHPVQHMISGPSKEKGSVSSGSDLIL